MEGLRCGMYFLTLCGQQKWQEIRERAWAQRQVRVGAQL